MANVRNITGNEDTRNCYHSFTVIANNYFSCFSLSLTLFAVISLSIKMAVDKQKQSAVTINGR